MEINQEARKSVKQHKKSCAVQREVLYPRGNQISSSKYRQRVKAKNVVDDLNGNLKHELRLSANDMFSVHTKSPVSHQGQYLEDDTSNDDELVKYMSNLPGYLIKEKDVNCQENVLNVGVLDWARLEKWKHKQRRLQAKVGKHTSSIPTLSNVHYSKNYARRRQPNSPSSSIDKLSHKNCCSRSVKPSSQRPICLRESEIVPEMTLKELLDIDKSEDIDSFKMETPLSNLRDSGISQIGKHCERIQNFEAEETLFEIMKRDDELFSDTKVHSSVIRNPNVSSSAVEKVSTKRAKTKRRAKKSLDSGISRPDFYSEQKSIVLLFPRNSRRYNFQEVDPYLEPGVSSSESLTWEREDITEQNEKLVLHSHFKEKPNSIELHPEIPPKASLQSTAECKAEKYLNPPNLNTQENQKSSGLLCELSPCKKMHGKLPKVKPVKQYRLEMNSAPKSVEEKAEDTCRSNITHSNYRLNNNPKVLDQETAELEAEKDRFLTNQQSSIPRLSRSLSLKEGPRVPHLSSMYESVRSGPLNSKLSAEFGTSNAEKISDKNRSVSGPIRRLLDPLLKSKGTKPPQSTGTGSVQPWKENFDFKPIYSSGFVNDKRDDKSIVQATLQLTIINDLPFYKLLVNNGTNILAASTKLFDPPAKDESGQNYTFYSVTEIKKKNGSWFTQGSKDGTTEYAYNVLGQMKVSDYSSTDLTGDCTDDHPLLKEAVLFRVELRQADNNLPKLILNEELAAVVIKDPNEVSSNRVELSKKDNNSPNMSCTECFIGDCCICKIRGSKACKRTTVILPGGIHSMPQKGGPSSLIDRWKSGGMCDCGGWDVGCKLRILFIKKCCKSCRTSKGCSLSVSNGFELYDQAEAEQDRPALSLVPFEEGMYTINFDASISVLQAFFIGVAVLSDKNLSSLSRGVTELAESKDGNMRRPAIISVQESYVPSPPNSPIGRA